MQTTSVPASAALPCLCFSSISLVVCIIFHINPHSFTSHSLATFRAGPLFIAKHHFPTHQGNRRMVMRFTFFITAIVVMLVSSVIALATESGLADGQLAALAKRQGQHYAMPIERSRRQSMYLKQATRSEIVRRHKKQLGRLPRASAQPSASPRPRSTGTLTIVSVLYVS